MSVADPYATGVLHKAVHDRLVADLPDVARDALIQPRWIWTPLAEAVNPKIVDWVRTFRQHDDVSGLCLTGSKAVAVEDQISAIAGALVRNFIRARVFTVGHLLDALEAGFPPSSTCLLIPNAYTGKASGAALPTWKVTALQDLLLDRHMRGQKTVIYVSDMNSFHIEYGSAFYNLVNNHYDIVGV